MSDLADFLLARIAEDEALNGVWSEMSVTGEDRVVDAAERADVQRCWDAYEHRIKADAEAKRQIVAEHERLAAWYAAHGAGGEYRNAYADVLRLLALPYAGHPDYPL